MEGLGGCRDPSSSVTLKHGQSAGKKVAQVIGQFAVVALVQGFLGKVAVFTERDFSEEKISKCIGTVTVNHDIRIDDVSFAFGHLFTFDGPPPVSGDLPGQR